MTDRHKDSIGKGPGNFIFQAGILAAAGVIVRIIGILYRSPLVAIIGDEGNGYYNTAYVIYTIILLISSYSIPSAISKVIAARLSLGEYRNAYRLFIGSIVYVVIVGGAASIVCFVFAGNLVGASSAQVLKIFAPTVFLSGLLGTLRGFFQAHHTMVYTSFSQILEQILNAIVSISAAYLFVRALSGRSETEIAIGGAKGSAIGTGAGVAVALIFMLLVYISNRNGIHARIASDKTKQSSLLSPLKVAGIIFGMVTPVVLSTCIYNLSTASNLKIYQHIVMEYGGYSEAVATTNYGLYSGKAMQIVNIPIALATAMSSAIIPSIAHSHERGELKEERRKIAYAIRVTMLIAIPSAFGLLSLAEPVTMLLYPQRASYKTVSHLIMALSVTVIFYCLSTLSNAILQGTGNVNIPVINSGISLVIQAGVLVLLLRNTGLDLYALCIVTVIYSLMMCILNSYAINRKLSYRQEYIRTFVMPVAAAVIMAAVTASLSYLVTYLIRKNAGDSEMIISGMNNVLRLVVGIVTGVLTYGLLTLRLGIIRENDFKALPKGTAIANMLKRIRLLR
ncbi:MAG: polysaccharide biosynthesis protein [Lachnospiraceae bacterium]|nr:polysaccharide biosynthesis protein [Lachnospiraceae bacterium]